MSLNRFNMSEILAIASGALPAQQASATDTITPTSGFEFCGVLVLTELTTGAMTEITRGTEDSGKTYGVKTGITVPAGVFIPGRWSSITVGAAGEILAYEQPVPAGS